MKQLEEAEYVKIVLAKEGELDRILEIYAAAKAFMRKSGNPNQWNGSYPERELLAQDIRKKQLYVMRENGHLCGVFAYITGEDPTYSYIENGAWLNNEPYGTIHRIAGDGTVKGLLARAVAFCAEKNPNIRVDTHKDNKPMQHALEKNGFHYCGIIYLANGDPRLAFQRYL